MSAASPSHRQHRRTAPYVIMNNHTQPPSVAYSARQSEQESPFKPENGIDNLANTPLQGAHREHIHITTTSFYALARRAQVCRKRIFQGEKFDVLFFQQAFRFLGVSRFACC